MSITNIILGLYLLIIGAMGLVQTTLPHWVPSILALIAGLLILFFGWRGDKRV